MKDAAALAGQVAIERRVHSSGDGFQGGSHDQGPRRQTPTVAHPTAAWQSSRLDRISPSACVAARGKTICPAIVPRHKLRSAMGAPANSATTFRYKRWKALVFGAVSAALGALMIGLGVVALDPSWTAHVARGQFIVDAPVWVRAPVLFVTGVFVLAPGLWLLFAGLTNATVVTAIEQAIVARTLFGRQRRLAWTDITVAKRKKNQIILSPVGTDTVGQEIWDRKSVFLDIGTLDVAPGAAEALIARHRPDVVIPATI